MGAGPAGWAGRAIQRPWGPCCGRRATWGASSRSSRTACTTRMCSEAGQDDIHYLNRFHDRLQALGFGLGLAYAQPPSDVVAARFKDLRATLDDYLAKFNQLVRNDVALFNKTAQERRAPVLVAGEPIEVKEVKVVSR